METAMQRSIRLVSPCLAAALMCVACGNTQQSCEFTALSVTPSSGTADHAVSAPGNQIQFVAAPVTKGQCAAGACVNCWGQTWTVSDPVNVSISNENLDNGMATCLGK